MQNKGKSLSCLPPEIEKCLSLDLLIFVAILSRPVPLRQQNVSIGEPSDRMLACHHRHEQLPISPECRRHHHG
jgi:hypothetical protein